MIALTNEVFELVHARSTWGCVAAVTKRVEWYLIVHYLPTMGAEMNGFDNVHAMAT